MWKQATGGLLLTAALVILMVLSFECPASP
jgi:hypothetical protein